MTAKLNPTCSSSLMVKLEGITEEGSILNLSATRQTNQRPEVIDEAKIVMVRLNKTRLIDSAEINPSYNIETGRDINLVRIIKWRRVQYKCTAIFCFLYRYQSSLA